MDSRDTMQLIACPKRLATETVRIFFESLNRSIVGMVLLINSNSIGLCSIFFTESATSRPCVTAAKILLAPFSWQTFAADTKVPAVEHISSARRTSFPLTSPIKVTTSTFVASDAMFIDDGEVNLEVASIGSCKLYTSDIGGNNNKVVMPYHLTGRLQRASCLP